MTEFPTTDGDAPAWPLSPVDDYLVHQTPDPIRIVWTSDVRAYDRYLVVGHSVKHDLIVATGGSQYPNLDMAESFTIVNHRGDHYAVRSTRTLGCDRFDLRVGPLRAEIVRPLRQWRFEASEDSLPLEYQLDWFDNTAHHLRNPSAGDIGGGQPRGRQRDVNAGFEGFGTLVGTIKVGEETIRLEPGDAQGMRDRHWGMRNGIGGATQLFGAHPPRGGNGLAFVDFGDWGLWGNRVLHPRKSGRPPIEVVDCTRRMRFDPETSEFRAGVVTYELSNGSEVELSFEQVPHLSAYLRAGFYGGPNGGAPGSGLWQGELPAERPSEAEIIDVRGSGHVEQLSGLNLHVCAVTCGGQRAVGVMQTYDPNARRRCEQGRHGWEIL